MKMKYLLPAAIFSILFFLKLNLFAQVQSSTYSKTKSNIELDWGRDAEIIDHPVYGVIVMSRDRWKNWVFRSMIIIMVYISLMFVILAIPKNSEINFIVSYILCGSTFVISFWESLSGWMLTRLNSYGYGWSFMLVSLPMYVASYFSTMRIKRYDISYAQIKEEFRKMSEVEAKNYTDPRLSPISGIPGDWEDEDFIKPKGV
ncbi:MAG: hypothetical protein KA059_06370 [Elusimicrobiales bacterium]|jgi:hypothetical protein|nr:hypothetical protein [Elusimicrobiales bacterium]NLH39802.1 hypothetical protein [Elusimicrobiota bacterium]